MRIYNSKKTLNRALELFPQAEPYIAHIHDIREIMSERDCAAWMLNNKAAGMEFDTLEAHRFILSKFDSCVECDGTGSQWDGPPMDPDSYCDDCSGCNGSGNFWVDLEEARQYYETHLYESGVEWLEID